MANKLHSGKVGPRLRPTEQCLLRRFFQALFQPPRLPDPPRRVSVSLFLFFSPLSLPGPFLRFLIPHPRAPLPSPRALGGRAKDRRSGRGEKVGSLADFSASTRVHRYLSITLPLLGRRGSVARPPPRSNFCSARASEWREAGFSIICLLFALRMNIRSEHSPFDFPDRGPPFPRDLGRVVRSDRGWSIGGGERL